MPRPRRNDRIELKYDKRGFGLVRGGVLYTEIAGRRLSSGLLAKADGSIDAKTRKKFEEILENRIEQHYNPSPVIKANSKSILDALEEYVPLYRKKVSEKTFKRLRSTINNYFIRDLMLSDVEEIRSMIAERMAHLKHGNNTVRKELDIMSAFFSFCIERQMMEDNPIDKYLYPSPKKNTRQKMSATVYEHMIKALASNNDIALLRLCNFIRITGCRIEECLSIKWSDVTPIQILIHGKGSMNRLIPRALFPELDIFLLEQRDYSKGDYLFHWRSYAGIELRVRQALQSSGHHKPGMNFHAIRKLAEHEMRTIRALPETVVVQIIGHTIDTAVSNYFEQMSAEELVELARTRKI